MGGGWQMAAMQAARLALVIALVCVAAALATPPGRLHPALRGIQRLLRRDAGLSPAAGEVRATPARRALAFILVLAAVAVAVL